LRVRTNNETQRVRPRKELRAVKNSSSLAKPSLA